MNYADTNWLEAVYITADPDDREARERVRLVEGFARQHGGQLALSQLALLEARNVFSRVTGEQEPQEWQQLEADFDGRVYVDPMNWDMLRRECTRFFSKYAWKAEIGTFDCALIASVKLGGGRRFLSFDAKARALAVAEGIEVFPTLDASGKRLLSHLKH